MTDKMVYLDIDALPKNVHVGNIEKFINIPDTSLNFDDVQPFEVEGVGTYRTIRDALNDLRYPELSKEELENMPPQELKNYKKVDNIDNYWAYVGLVIISKIKQNKDLLNLLMSRKKPIACKRTKVSTKYASVDVIERIDGYDMYTGVVRYIAYRLRKLDPTSPTFQDDLEDEFENILYALKNVKDAEIPTP